MQPMDVYVCGNTFELLKKWTMNKECAFAERDDKLLNFGGKASLMAVNRMI